MFQLHKNFFLTKKTIPKNLNALRELGERDISSHITNLLQIYMMCSTTGIKNLYSN